MLAVAADVGDPASLRRLEGEQDIGFARCDLRRQDTGTKTQMRRDHAAALRLGVGDALEAVQEQRLRVHVHQRDVVVIAEHGLHLFALVHPQQAVVDEHAGQLVADRLVDQHRGDRGIDAAREAADHLAGPDLLADALDRLLAKRLHGPVAAAAGDVAHEVADEQRPVRGVDHLGVELDAVEAPPLVGHGREGGVLGQGDGVEPVRQLGDPVAVAHPDGIALADVPDAPEQVAVGDDLDLGAAELAVVPRLHLAAELAHEHAHIAGPEALRLRRGTRGRGRREPADRALRLHHRQGRLRCQRDVVFQLPLFRLSVDHFAGSVLGWPL